MMRSGSSKSLRVCALLVLILCIIVGGDSLMKGAEGIQSSSKTVRAAAEIVVLRGLGIILAGVLGRELINGFSIVVASHEQTGNAVPVARAAAPRAAAPQARRNQPGWVCSHCHTENAADQKQCESCGRDRKAPAVQAREAAPRSQLSFREQMRRASQTAWNCPQCGTENPVSIGRCKACGSMKPYL